MVLMENGQNVPKNKFVIKIARYVGLGGIFFTKNENSCRAANF